MANYNLTNQTISSSFQQLLQKDTDTGNLVDGLGNPIDGANIQGDVTIQDNEGLTILNDGGTGAVKITPGADFITKFTPSTLTGIEQIGANSISSSQGTAGQITGGYGVQNSNLTPAGAGNVRLGHGDSYSSFKSNGYNGTVTLRGDEITLQGSSSIDSGVSFTVNGDVSASNFTGSFIGDGSGLTNLPTQTLPSGVVSGSAQISDITGSSLTTASFASQTLTFTKGDGSTFGVNIPDVSGSDISALNQFTQSQEELNTTLATTGSNTFNGDQIIDSSNLVLDSIGDIVGTSGINFTGSFHDLTLVPSGSTFAGFGLELDGAFQATKFFGDGSGLTGISGGGIDTGSFATTGSNTFDGDQTINGSSTANISAPAQNNEIGIVDMSGASIGGRPYNRAFFGVADYSQFGLNLEDYFAIEYYDGFGYNFGSEFNVNGKQINLQTSASGSGQQSYVRTTDNYDGTSQVSIGSGNKVAMNGFVEVAGTMNVSGVTNFGTSGSLDKMNVFGGIVLSQGAGIQTDGVFGPAVPFDAPVVFFGGVQFNNSGITTDLQVTGSVETTKNIIVNGDNTAGPGNTFQANNGSGTPILSVQNATLKGFTDIDVLVNGNTFFNGDINATGSLGIADNPFTITSGSNSVEFSAKFSDGQAGVVFTAPNSKFTANGNMNLQALGGIFGVDAQQVAFYSNTITSDGNHTVNGTNTAPGQTFIAKDGNGTPRIAVNNATLSGLSGIDVISNGNTQIGGDLTAQGNAVINGTNAAPGSTFTANDGNGTPILQVNNATLKGFTGVDVLVNGNLFNDGNFTADGDIITLTSNGASAAALNLTYNNPAGTNAGMIIGQNNLNNTFSDVLFEGGKMFFGTGAENLDIAFGNGGTTNSINFAVNGSGNALNLSTARVRTNLNLEVGTQLVLVDYLNLDFANDSAAAAGGVPLGGIYHNNSSVKIRVT